MPDGTTEFIGDVMLHWVRTPLATLSYMFLQQKVIYIVEALVHNASSSIRTVLLLTVAAAGAVRRLLCESVRGQGRTGQQEAGPGVRGLPGALPRLTVQQKARSLELPR